MCVAAGGGTENDRDHFTAGRMLNKDECAADDDDEGAVCRTTTSTWNSHSHTHTEANGAREVLITIRNPAA